jgi:hypothetical protein
VYENNKVDDKPANNPMASNTIKHIYRHPPSLHEGFFYARTIVAVIFVPTTEMLSNVWMFSNQGGGRAKT